MNKNTRYRQKEIKKFARSKRISIPEATAQGAHRVMDDRPFRNGTTSFRWKGI